MPPPTMTMSYLVGVKGICQNPCSACHANHCTVDTGSVQTTSRILPLAPFSAAA
jgi:hypothetical protein